MRMPRDPFSIGESLLVMAALAITIASASGILILLTEAFLRELGISRMVLRRSRRLMISISVRILVMVIVGWYIWSSTISIP